MPRRDEAHGGRPKGRVGGRNLALQTLDAMLAEERNQENLRAALQALD
jgi:hypothetical protein